jgi:outer membrane receptor protein involved in Fe transport
MKKCLLLASGCSVALSFASVAVAQEAAPVPAPVQTAVEEAAPEGEIIITATRRAQALSDVPIAVSAVTADALSNSGASDIRQLNQLSPSLLVSSTSSEAGAGVARIRGIGTVGDNPGLESSVAVFIDGVYRNRSGVALTELGDVERIEVLRGPQGTLFGRNASAGLINIVTRAPSFEVGGTAEATYGNYDFLRLAGSVTGPIVADKLAARIDGVYVERDGFLKDAISGRRINDRDRYLVRGQLLAEPNDDLSIRIIGDFADRKEECCGSTYLPGQIVTRDANGNLQFGPNPVAALIRSFGGIVNDDTFNRTTSITPGRDFRSDVRDWGVSGEVTYNLGAAELTSITAYRDYRFLRGQDADFNNLDILYRDDFRQQFKTFTQEARLQGEAFDDRLDWLVGGYYANERLTLSDNLRYGADYDRYAAGVVRLTPALAAFPGYNNLRAFAGASLAAGGVPAAAIPTLTAFVPNITLAGTGVGRDDYRQKSRNYAFFTHNIFDVTDRLSVTVGLRYTNERKTLDASFVNTNTGCAQLLGGIAGLRGVTGALAPAATGLANNLQALAALPCVIPPVSGALGSGSPGGTRKESEWSGTGVVSYKLTDDLLTYASYSKGYKAGGFNLDRSALNPAAPTLAALQFEPEKVDAYEIGAKYNGGSFNLNAAAFYQAFDSFQLNTFNGLNFIVENIQSCGTDLGGADTDASATTGACAADDVRAGVVSKGVEVEAQLLPLDDLAFSLGATVADTSYRDNLTGFAGRPLAPTLFQLPDSKVSNAASYVLTGAATYTPEIGQNGMTGLLYADFRYQSAINTGSDKDVEKVQPGVFVMNARVGLAGPDKRWSLELWAQNLLDTDYQQVTFDAPLQGSNTTAAVQRGFAASSTQLYGAFLAEPRTYGVTLRTKF